MTRDSRIPELVSVSEAADMLGVSRQMVHKMVRKHQLPGAQIGNTWVLRRNAVTSRIPRPTDNEKTEQSAS